VLQAPPGNFARGSSRDADTFRRAQVAATATTDELGDAAVDLVEQLLEAYFMQVCCLLAQAEVNLAVVRCIRKLTSSFAALKVLK